MPKNICPSLASSENTGGKIASTAPATNSSGTEHRESDMDEIELIRSFAAGFPRSPNQGNLLFESDAEIFTVGDVTLAITTDE